jgi:hypothetical protein
MEEGGLRRLELARTGFTYDVRRAIWRCGDGIHRSEEGVDTLEPWQMYLCWWRSTRPRPWTGGSPMREPWGRVACEHFTGAGRLTAPAQRGVITGMASVFGSIEARQPKLSQEGYKMPGAI